MFFSPDLYLYNSESSLSCFSLPCDSHSAYIDSFSFIALHYFSLALTFLTLSRILVNSVTVRLLSCPCLSPSSSLLFHSYNPVSSSSCSPFPCNFHTTHRDSFLSIVFIDSPYLSLGFWTDFSFTFYTLYSYVSFPSCSLFPCDFHTAHSDSFLCSISLAFVYSPSIFPYSPFLLNIFNNSITMHFLFCSYDTILCYPCFLLPFYTFYSFISSSPCPSLPCDSSTELILIFSYQLLLTIIFLFFPPLRILANSITVHSLFYSYDFIFFRSCLFPMFSLPRLLLCSSVESFYVYNSLIVMTPLY